jgi:hypothetical protein
MTRKSKKPPGRNAEGEAEAARRQARLGDALRANLLRRKAQTRRRATDAGGGNGFPDAPDRGGA